MSSSTKNIGNFGEKIAKNFLLSRGYEIREQNLRLGHKEIDLIAQDQNWVIFIEVKTNACYWQDPEFALSSKQIRTLKKAISSYCFHNRINKNHIRLDLITITLNKSKKRARLKHYKDII